MKFAYQIIGGMVLVVVLLGGLLLLQQGVEMIFLADGQDIALPGDEVGELEVVSTRQVSVEWAGVWRLAAGTGLIVGGLAITRFLSQDTTSTNTSYETT